MAKYQTCGCGRKSGKYGETSFDYSGYKLKITKLGSECQKCARKEFLSNFDNFRGKIIKDGKGIVIDWNYYSHVNEEIKPQLNKILVALNILSYSSNGNWEIVGGGLNLNPFCLYFTRRKDILDFARIKFSTTLYSCEVRKISEVIKQEKFSRPV